MFFDDGAASVAVPVHDGSLGGSLFQVLSHLGFFILVVVFFVKRAYYASAISLSTSVISTMYHMCKAAWYCFGFNTPGATLVLGSPLLRWRVLDHMNSNHSVGAILLTAALSEAGGGRHVVAYRTLLPFVCALGVLGYPFQMQAAFLMLAYVALVVGFEYVYVREMRLPPPDRFHFLALGAALLLGAIGFALYFFDFGLPADIAHGLWHVLIEIVLAIVVFATNQRRM